MKISEVLSALYVDKSSVETNSQTKHDEQMYAANFNNMDGLEVESSSNKKEETYEKTIVNDFGETITETYSKADNSLISKSRRGIGVIYKDYYQKGTDIVTTSEIYYSDNNNLKEKTIYSDQPPYDKKKTLEYYSDGSLCRETYFKNGDNVSRKIEHTAYGTEEVNYVYKQIDSYKSTRLDGSLREVVEHKINYKSTQYRADGSVYQIQESRDAWGREKISSEKYDKNGNVISRQFQDEEGNIIQQSIHNNVVRLSDTISRGNLKERTIYNKDGSIYIHNEYDNRGKITQSIKNEFKSDPNLNKFDETRLDGKLDAIYGQGKTGICYAASGVLSFMRIEKGQQIIDESIKHNDTGDSTTISFDGVGKEYTFSKEEVDASMGRLAFGDPDFTAFLLGWEKYRTEEHGKIADGGLSNELFYALCGDEGENNIMMGMTTIPMDQSTLDGFKECLEQGNYAITVNTPPETVDNEFTEEEEKSGFKPSHSYCLDKVTDTEVFVIDPADQNVLKMSREKFLETFFLYCSKEL